MGVQQPAGRPVGDAPDHTLEGTISGCWAGSSLTPGPPADDGVLLDTSVLIAAERGPEEDAAISVVSLTELHFGVLVARDDETRALQARRLGAIEEHFDALPFDAGAARERGWLHALVARRGGAPRRRAMGLAIAATANVHGVPSMTYNTKDFKILAEEIDLHEP
jgi:predicted nucleic acid-binding protein